MTEDHRILLDRHLAALREQADARVRRAEAEGELLDLARPLFEQLCAEQRTLHPTMIISREPWTEVVCEVERYAIVTSASAFADLPSWLIALGETYDEARLRDDFGSGAGLEAIPPDALEKLVHLRRDYELPAEILEHPSCRDPAVQQHIAWLISSGVLELPSTVTAATLLEQWRRGEGLERLRTQLGSRFDTLFAVQTYWRPAPAVESLKYADNPDQRAAFRQLEDLGLVRIQLRIKTQVDDSAP
jgi:hypothetical protein